MDTESSQTNHTPILWESHSLEKKNPKSIPVVCIPQVGGDGHRELFSGSIALEKQG